ncbi:MAG: CBS domain-containing protein [Pseudomonadota bacterium]
MNFVKDLPFVSEVQTLGPDQTVADAVELFQNHKIGSVVIVDRDSRVLGIFTERDYIYKVAGEVEGSESDPISKHMTANPKAVNLEDQILKASISMRLGRFRHVVVVNDANRLVGVISIKDLLDWSMDKVSEVKS